MFVCPFTFYVSCLPIMELKTQGKWLDSSICWVKWASVWQIEKFNRPALVFPQLFPFLVHFKAIHTKLLAFDSIPFNWMNDENYKQVSTFLLPKRKTEVVDGFFNVDSYECHTQRTNYYICHFNNVHQCILKMDEIEAKHKNLLTLFDEQWPQITRFK